MEFKGYYIKVISDLPDRYKFRNMVPTENWEIFKLVYNFSVFIKIKLKTNQFLNQIKFKKSIFYINFIYFS